MSGGGRVTGLSGLLALCHMLPTHSGSCLHVMFSPDKLSVFLFSVLRSWSMQWSSLRSEFGQECRPAFRLTTEADRSVLAPHHVEVVCAFSAPGASAAAAVVLSELEASLARDIPALSPRFACLVEVR